MSASAMQGSHKYPTTSQKSATLPCEILMSEKQTTWTETLTTHHNVVQQRALGVVGRMTSTLLQIHR